MFVNTCSMKRKENMKFWQKILKIWFCSIFKKFIKKFKQHSINIKYYTAHPHDLVHIPAKFRENTAMRFWVIVRKLNVTDRQTDGQTDGRGGVAISPVPGPTAPAGDNKKIPWRLKHKECVKTKLYGLDRFPLSLSAFLTWFNHLNQLQTFLPFWNYQFGCKSK